MKIYLLITSFLLVLIGTTKSENVNCEHIICPMIWLPLCAKSGSRFRTFGNMCALKRINCIEKPAYEIVNLGWCPPDADADTLRRNWEILLHT